MKTFYIFLDIDGVLYDWDYIIAEMESGRMKRGSFIDKFKPDSINALNYLIKSLNAKYNVELVISSTWRHNLQFACRVLYKNGLIYDKPIYATPISSDPAKRGQEILSYLLDKSNYDFVIIDDENFNFNQFFQNKNIIKTEMYHAALSKKQIDKFLSTINCYTK